MGATKTEKFSNKQNKLAATLKALGHPARIAIVELLATSEACTCGEIVQALPLSQATVSQHLKEMRLAGLLDAKEVGASVYYSLNGTAISKLRKYLGKVRKAYRQSNKY